MDMMKQEFENLIGKSVSEADYKVIETVYTWHPAITNQGGKEQIAKLYTEFGMSVIRGMVDVSEAMAECESERVRISRRTMLLEQREKRLRDGDTSLERIIKEVLDLFMRAESEPAFKMMLNEVKGSKEDKELALEIAEINQ